MSKIEFEYNGILGEADGQGEGYHPYLQSGAGSMRIDVKDEILAFWESLIQKYSL